MLAGLLVYFGVRAATDSKAGLAEAHARSLVHLEHKLGIAREGDVQSVIIDHHWLVTLANWVYIWGHWPLIAVSAVWLFRYRPDAYRLMRTAIFISGAIGMIIFLTYPVAPPRLTGLGLTDTVTRYSHAYRALQPPSLMDRYAALPSLHFGWDLLVGLTLARFHPRTAVRILGALMPVAMGARGRRDRQPLRDRRHRRRNRRDDRARARDAAHPRARATRPRALRRAVRQRDDVVDAPLLIAHRAGNEPERLRAAERGGADVIEADLHLRRGRLELRHLKTVGSLPVYWDRWALAPPWRRFDDLGDLLAAAQPETALLLDLKGRDPAVARMTSDGAWPGRPRCRRLRLGARVAPARRDRPDARPPHRLCGSPARSSTGSSDTRRLARSMAPRCTCGCSTTSACARSGRTRHCSCRGPSTTATRRTARRRSA